MTFPAYDNFTVEFHSQFRYLGSPLREKCPKTDFFLVRIFPYSDILHTVVRGTSESLYSPSPKVLSMIPRNSVGVWNMPSMVTKDMRICGLFQFYFDSFGIYRYVKDANNGN